MIEDDLELLTEVVENLTQAGNPKERAVNGLRMVARLLVAERALTKPPPRSRGPLIAIAATLAQLQHMYDTGVAGTFPLTDSVRRRLAAWYWLSVLADTSLRGRNQIASAADELVAWVATRNGARPADILDGPRILADLRLREPASPGLEYVLDAVELQTDPRDLLTGEPIIAARAAASFAGEPVDRHHVFPSAWCNRRGVPAAGRDAPVNLVLLSASANRGLVGEAPPSEYLPRIVELGVPRSRLDDLLRGHGLDSAPLWADDQSAASRSRESHLRALLQRATQY